MLRRVLAAVAIVGTVFASSASAAETPKQWDRHRVNYLRANHGLGSVVYNRTLQNRAQYWASHMARYGLADDSAGYRACWKIGGGTYGSNVGVTPTTGGAMAAVKRIEYAFEKSAPHRSNLFDPSYRLLGLGLVKSGGRYWFVQDYCGGGSTHTIRLAPPLEIP